MMALIEVDNVTKIFTMRSGLRNKLLPRLWGRARAATPTFEALKGISLQVEPGESVGIIGRNGSGKSTLLKLIAGVTLPTEGEVTVRGRVASLLELGAGFHPMLTGRENIYLNAGLLGVRRAQVEEVFERIVEFSGIRDFIDQPVETYSSGMYVRLAFSVAVHANPDIFLVDEVLSVGDEEFQRKCRRRIGELREQKKTIVFVSHDLGIVNSLCERVILLNRGEMINRGSVQKTFEYYLRQIGQEQGIHTLRDGSLETVLCDGRLSLFHGGQELSSPSGFAVRIESMGQIHHPTDADWRVTEKSDTECRARGRFSRLPLSLIYRLKQVGGKVRWDLSIECEREVSLPAISAHLALNTAYTQWLYGDLSGTFPELLPSDTNWNVLVASERTALEAAASAEKEEGFAPVVFRLRQGEHDCRLWWANSDYVTNSRVLQATVRLPERQAVYAKGVHTLFSLEIDTGVERDKLQHQLRSRRIIESGSVSARFEMGQIRIAYEGKEITDFLHLYTSMLIEHLWNDSHSLQWGAERAEGDAIVLVGESRRFPMRQEWRIRPVPSGISLEIWLENREELRVQEYHASVVLCREFEHWRTDQEEGVFPEFDPQLQHWQHLNASYPPGHTITALSSEGVSITIETSEQAANIPFRMTAINTMSSEHARVLQALCPSESGRLLFAPGRHLYFAGIIRVEKKINPIVPPSPGAEGTLQEKMDG